MIALLFALASLHLSCGGPEPPKRFAILRFEDLSGDAAHAWMGRALSEAISGELEGSRHQAVLPFTTIHQFDAALGPRSVSAPGISAERSAALASGANWILTGYYSVKGDRLSVAAVEERLESRTVATTQNEAGLTDDLLHLADTIARQVDDEARPPVTGSLRALRSYSLALESSSAQEAQPLFAEAVHLDPDLGAAWVSLARLAIAAKDTNGFDAVFREVRARGNGVRAIDRGILNLEEARLHGSATAQTDALSALVRLTPADPFRIRELAAAELNQNRYAEAADHYRRLTTLLPTDSETLNELGYALLFAGDQAGARKAFEDYRSTRPNDANPLDSMGDFHFFFGRWKEAEQSYLDAYTADPNLIDGGELLKAAWARLMRNDRAGAAALLDRYRADRSQVNDKLAAYRIAQLDRLMGRKTEAATALQGYAVQSATLQAAWWRYLDDAGPPPDASSKLGQAVVALHRRDWATASPLWRDLAENSPPPDWWMRAVYGRLLVESGQTGEARRWLKFAPLPNPNAAVSLDELWYPWMLSARSSN